MVHPRTPSLMDRATLKKASVCTTPLWAQEHDPFSTHDGCASECGHDGNQTQRCASALSNGMSSSHGSWNSSSSSMSLPMHLQRNHSSSTMTSTVVAPSWSVFATMSNVSVLSDRLAQQATNRLNALAPPLLPTTSSTAATRTATRTMPTTTNIPTTTTTINTKVHSTGRDPSHRRIPPRLDHFFPPLSTMSSNSTNSGSRCSCPTPAGPGSTHSSSWSTSCPIHNHGLSIHPLQSIQQLSNPHPHRHSWTGLLSPLSKKQSQKHSLEVKRGYPTRLCLSTDPPPTTTWDEKDNVDSLLLGRRQSIGTNMAFNLDAFKMFLSSPFFSSILKAITILIAVLLAAFTLEAIMMLSRPLPHHLQELLMRAQQERQQQDQQLQSGQSGHSGQLPIEFPLWLPNDKASLVVTAVFSIITIAYSCLTMVLESRRPPEGLDTSKSKPLIVIFSEIIASIVWAQILSVTIYIYIWTFGCAEPGERPLEMLWRLSNGLSSITSSTPLPPSSSTNSTLSSTTSSIPPSTMTVLAAIVDENRDLMDRICRRQGAMAGLEFMLVLLLIWNFYTNLAKNFQFIRAVSRS